MDALVLRLLGDCEARVGDGCALALPTRKARALLAMVAMAPNVRLRRERLCATLWERSAEDQARASLRQTLSSVRRALSRAGADGVLRSSRDEVWLDAGRCVVDALRFEALTGQATPVALSEAAAMYRGDFCAGLSLREEAFESWLIVERRRLQELARRALGAHLAGLMDAHEYARAADVAARLLTIDPLQDNAHRALMAIHAREGRRAMALRQFESFRDLLERELGVGPEEETVALAASIRAGAQKTERGLALDDAAVEAGTSSMASNAAWSGEIRPVTVLYATLLFDEPDSAGDLEHQHDAVVAFQAEVERIAREAGGRIERRIGDSAVVTFGAPVTAGNEGERALRAALDLCAIEPRARTGVVAGQVIAAAVADEYTITGESVDQAHRLAHLGSPGSVLATEPVWRLALAYFDTEPMPEVSLPARGRRIEVRRVVRLRSRPNITRPSRLIGRSRELRQLTAVIAGCVEDHRGQAVYVRGEPGIGKTRLLEETMVRARALGCRVHLVRVFDFGAGRMDNVLSALLFSLLSIDSECDAEGRRTRADGAIDSGLLTQDARAFVHDLLDLPQPSDLRALYEAMDESARLRGKQSAVCDLIEQVSRQSPLLIAVEDIHWAGPGVLDHLGALIRRAMSCAVVVVMTSRLDEDPLDRAWRASVREMSMLSLDLGPLRDEEANRLALEFADPEEHALAETIKRAQGNPLFLEQLLRMRREGGAAHEVPRNVQELALARSDRLPPFDRAALQAAAVLGHRFSTAALSFLLQCDHYDCAPLLERDLVRPDDEDWLFSHALIRDGILVSLLPSTRRALHARAAEWFASRDAILYASHLEAAADARAARAWLDAASTQARAYRTALALELLDRGLEACSDNGDRFELLHFKGELLLIAGPLGAAIEALEESIEFAPDDIARCRALTSLAMALRQVSEFDAAYRALDAAQPIAEQHKLHNELARIAITRGNLAFRVGEIDHCLPHHERALEHAQQAGSDELRIHALGGMGDAYYAMGRIHSAHEHLTRCVEEARRFGFARIESTHRIMGTHYWRLEFDIAEHEALEALKTARQVGSPSGELQANLVVAQVATARLELDKAAGYASEAVDIADRLGADRVRSRCLHYRARVHAAAGENARALPMLEEALAIAYRTGVGYCGPAIVGTLLLVTNDPGRRRDLLREGEELLGRGVVAHNAQEFLTDAAETCLRSGAHTEAVQYSDRLENWFRMEPTPLTTFLIGRIRALAALQSDPDDASALADLRQLHEQAIQTQYRLPQEAMRIAIKGAGGCTNESASMR